MNKQHFLIIMFTLAFVFAGCTDSDEGSKPTHSAYEPVFSGTIESFGNSWHGMGLEKNDTLCIYAVNAGKIVASQYYIPEESSTESRIIPLSQQFMSLKEDQNYQFYSTRKTYIPVQATGDISSALTPIQRQQKGNDNSHICNYDFIYAKAEIVDKQVRFTYKHTYALLEFELPAGVKAITIEAVDPNEEYAGARIFSPKNDVWIHHMLGYATANLQLEEPTTKDNEKGWLLIYPGHESKPFDLVVRTTDHTIYRIPHTAPANGYQAGQTYTLKVNLQEARQILEPPTNDGKSWQIDTAVDLQWFRDNVNSGATNLNASLIADIDLQGNAQNVWHPIGIVNAYIGHFNGNGHHISQLYIDNIKNITGLWAELEAPGCIENLEISGEIVAVNSSLSGPVGGIVGCLYGGTVRQCHSSVNITVDNSISIGGISGDSWGTISDCYYDGQIRATGLLSMVGTILGSNKGLVENCYTTGALYYASSMAGGICGGNESIGEIRNCVVLCRHWQSMGDICSSKIGRIAGYNCGKAHQNIAMNELIIGVSFSDGESMQGISKSWNECLSPRLYTDELGWSSQIWRFAQDDLPILIF